MQMQMQMGEPSLLLARVLLCSPPVHSSADPVVVGQLLDRADSSNSRVLVVD
eukprot:00945_2